MTPEFASLRGEDATVPMLWSGASLACYDPDKTGRDGDRGLVAALEG